MDDFLLDELKTNHEGLAELEIPAANLPVLEEMSKAGLFLGHKKSKTHPRMKPYIFTTRNGTEIIDLAQTLEIMEKAMEFVKSKLSKSPTSALLLVGTTPASKTATENLAKKLNLPNVTGRWLGGTLTNFGTISKRIAYFKKLRADREAGRLDKYTKKERLGFDREIEKLTEKFSGIENMSVLPDVLFAVEVTSHLTAIREAKRMKIPVVAMVNTDADPALVDYPIPVNDRGKASVEWVLAKLESAILEARQSQPPIVKQ